jgi:hypothetical protein
LIAVFGFVLSGCDVINELLGKGGDSGNDGTVTQEPMEGLATGGDSTKVIGVEGDSSLVWEIHTFTQSGTLAFSSGDSVVADYLIVAGGGGSAGGTSLDGGGGGGAGGLLYRTGQTLQLAGGAVAVTVGQGGAGGSELYTQGGDGGDSAIGNSITVPGGGGGGSAIDSNAMEHPAYIDGRAGGSGGGGGGGAYTYGAALSGPGKTGTNGNASDIPEDMLGYAGGQGSVSGGYTGDSGGGGGGAGGAGANGVNSKSVIAAGGAPWKATTNENTAWIQEATSTDEFSRGGNSGGLEAAVPGVNYGDGGSGTFTSPGAAGHSGIVVIRFQSPLAGDNPE